MADFRNSVTGSPFNSFKSSNVFNKTVSSSPTKTQESPKETPKEPAIKNEQIEAYLKSKVKDAMPYVATGASALAVGASIIAYRKSAKNTKLILNELNQIKGSVSNIPTKNTMKGLTTFMLGLIGAGTGASVASHFDSNKDNLKNIGLSDTEINTARDNAKTNFENRENSINEAKNIANDAKKTSEDAISTATTFRLSDGTALQIHRKPYCGINLLVVDQNDKYVNDKKLASALDDIHTAVDFRNGRKPGDTDKYIREYKDKYVPLMGSNSTWSITAEYDPIKAGGLGSVPMEIHNNFSDMGIDNPVFIPMYQFKGKSEFIESRDEKSGKKLYKYNYDGHKFDLEKMAEMPVTQYRGNKVINQNVEFYLGHAERNGSANPDQPIVFVKNVDNFGGDIYANNFNASEPEKFAFLSKAVYQLAEAKVSEALGESKSGLGEMKILNKKAYDEVKAPVGMMLNDWHAAPMAGLLRYRAPMENAYNGISDNVKVALRDMPLEMVGHNAGIPGSTRKQSQEFSDLQTENIINTLYDGYAAGIVENATTGRKTDSVSNSVLWERNDKGNRQFNNLAHGIALSDVYVPVSKNYEKELKEDIQQSGLALDAITAKKESGDIRGIINGLDRSTSSTIAKADWLKRRFGMEIKPYNHNTPIDKIMEARQHNKGELYDHYVKPIQEGSTSLGNIVGTPSNISKEDFMNAPLFVFAHRLTSQKGLPLYKNAVIEMFNTWDEKHPGKPKPFIIAGGQLDEPEQAPYLDELKNPDNYKNKDDVNRIIGVQGFMPNPALMAAATYFVAPSTFEPCGLTQGECYAMGTPIITTATGGFVDTIKDKENGFVAPYKSYHNEVECYKTKEERDAHAVTWMKEMGSSLAGKFDEAMNTYFDNYDKYKQIVDNNIHMNLSWNRNSDDDAIHQHMKVLGITKKDVVESHVAPLRKNVTVKTLKKIDNFIKEKEIAEKSDDPEVKDKFMKSASKNLYDIMKSAVKGNYQYIDNLKSSAETNKKQIEKYDNDIAKTKVNGKLTDDLKQANIETISISQNNVKEKLGYKDEALGILANDEKMLKSYYRMVRDNNTNPDDYKEINAWKENLYKKYTV